MLTRFSVENFKAFNNKLEFILDKPGNYEFNSEAIKEGVVNKAIIYGFNGCGKSSLGLAIFDIVSHLTDKQCIQRQYIPYLSLYNPQKAAAIFEYCFSFSGTKVTYRYEKKNLDTLKTERLWIDEKEVLNYDFDMHKGFLHLKGAETLNLESKDAGISRVKYVSSNAILENNHENNVFRMFIDFVNKMLLFYSLEDRQYQGFQIGSDNITDGIIESGKVDQFQEFLKENYIDLQLGVRRKDGEKQLVAKFPNGAVDFFSIASTGTRSLALLFYWYVKMDKASFVFIDEFDAFYHYELAENIVKLMKELASVQVILTTHNTDLLSNDLLRPDCYYWLNESSITPISDLTEKEIRKAHNLQKMFKAGAFRER